MTKEELHTKCGASSMDVECGTNIGSSAGAGRSTRGGGQAGGNSRAMHANTPTRRWVRLFALLVVLLCVLAVVWYALIAAQDSARDQSAETVRIAVLSAANQCAAVEGSYPSTIEYLEKHYGLAINTNDYVVNYEAFASNVPPTVTVVPR